ncbi:MAG: tyrosine-protein phosphatase [Pirellulaceae bacterium]
MHPRAPLIDIHCHLLPEIDDGAKSWDESLAMARLACDDGVGTIVVTPHQLGAFTHNRGDQIREATCRLQEYFVQHDVALQVLPGAEVRVEPDLVERVRQREVLTLGDRGKCVLLELPHDMYVPLDPCLDELQGANMVGILSHPERNQGLLRAPGLVESLVQRGCLMQVTAGSLLGTFGGPAQAMAESMVQAGWVHFVATDAHGSRSRRPLMMRAFHRVVELAGEPAAHALCCQNPACVAAGKTISVVWPANPTRPARWFNWRQAA